MKKTYYHGTSADVLEAVLKKGLQPIPHSQRIWNDSYPNRVYLWDDVATNECGLIYAQDSATSAIIRAKDKRIVVFEIVMSDKYVHPDCSGYGMDDQGAVEVECVPKRYITGYWISEDVSLYTAFWCKYYFSNNIARHQPTKLEKHCIGHLPDSIFLSPVDELPIQWEYIALKQSQLKKVA